MTGPARRRVSRIARRLAERRGFALPELLVGTIIALMVAAAGMVVLQIAVRDQPQVSQRAAQIQQGRTLLETLTRELRQGESIEVASPTGLEILTYVNSASCGGGPSETAIQCWVSYACENGVCTRTEHDDGGGGTTTQVATGLLDDEVFSYCADNGSGTQCDLDTASFPTYVGVELAYPGDDGEEAITLADGVALRNHLTPQPE